MKPFPTTPIQQNNMLLSAFCDDLRNGGNKTRRVAEIAKQMNERDRHE
jgi:hypothetical protein